jgi:hypothetical protein
MQFGIAAAKFGNARPQGMRDHADKVTIVRCPRNPVRMDHDEAAQTVQFDGFTDYAIEVAEERPPGIWRLLISGHRPTALV